MINKFTKIASNPFIQAFGVWLLYLIVMSISFILKVMGMDIEARSPWTLAIAFILLYMLYNVIIGLISDRMARYWLYSLMAFMLLMLLSAFTAGWVSGVGMDEAGTYRWLFFIFCPVYLLFIGMISAIKKIVELAKDDDNRYDNQNQN